MQTLLFLLALLLFAVAIVGAFVGWWHVTAPNNGTPNVTLLIEKHRLVPDQDEEAERLRDLEHSAVDDLEPATENTQGG
jgi:uncharacterized membrane protein YqiK